MGIIEIIKRQPVKVSIVCAVSIGVGVASYFISGKIEKAIAERDLGYEDEACVDEAEDDEDDVEDVEDDIPDERERFTPPEFEKPPLVDYTAFAKKNREEKDERQEVKDDRFEFISEEEYMSLDEPDHIKADGTWFASDRILAGWNNELSIRDPKDTIGEEALKKLEDPSVDSIFVRNKELGVDYQIMRSESDYESAYADAMMAPATR